jgi:hypothetical protein
VVINNCLFTELEISQYYRTKPGRSTVSDEKIRELVKQLNGNGKKATRDNEYFSSEPLYIGYRAYNLIWDYDDNEFTGTLLIIDCYREKKYDKK